MKKLYYILIALAFPLLMMAQSNPYENAYNDITCMLEGNCKTSFKKAVYLVENAYLQNTLDSTVFNGQINSLVLLADNLVKSRKLLYSGRDKQKVEKYAAIFSVIKDTIPIQTANGDIYDYIPFSYDFNDVWGHGDWSKMFVSKLLLDRKGNCHSLPYLYKIVAEEIGVDAHLALAPNHIYIKHYIDQGGWYNTELTSGIFPIDAWLKASGYISLEAIQNSAYMEALDNKQSLALCLIDLAQGYNRLNEVNDGTFILKCVETALEYYPHYINGLILRAETTKKILELRANEKFTDLMDAVKKDETIRNEFLKLQNDYVAIYDLGYREMPEKMYLDWLTSLQREREKYENKDIKHN